jgi:hypothetical protein
MIDRTAAPSFYDADGAYERELAWPIPGWQPWASL